MQLTAKEVAERKGWKIKWSREWIRHKRYQRKFTTNLEGELEPKVRCGKRKGKWWVDSETLEAYEVWWQKTFSALLKNIYMNIRKSVFPVITPILAGMKNLRGFGGESVYFDVGFSPLTDESGLSTGEPINGRES